MRRRAPYGRLRLELEFGSVKRPFDFVIALLGLIVLSPILLIVSILIWTQDRRSPFYVADRVGREERPFQMVKFRSMVVNADRSGVDSTSSDDVRITVIGRLIRRTKLDELPQLWNVLRGEMSLVGPRPNVEREVRLYSPEEKRLLSIRPGITDLASIVFADEGDILHGQDDPDIAYNQLIRPGKNQLGLFYVDNQTRVLDIQVVALTVMNAVSRSRALAGAAGAISKRGATPTLVAIAHRQAPLQPTPPPGMDAIVTSRD